MDEANFNDSPFNIIPVKAQVHTYLRDPALLTTQNNQQVYSALPYSQSTGTSIALTKEVAELCGYKYENTYADLAKFNSTYSMIGQVNDICKIGKSGNITTGCEKTPGTNNANSGGNFMAMPDGTLVVGQSKKHIPDSHLIEYFQKSQTVVTVPIPELEVGHLDEVIRFIPRNDKCGYSILRASPSEMITFLKSRPLVEKISNKPWDKNKTVKDVLADTLLMDTWIANDKIISDSVERLLKVLKVSKPDCQPEVINLPVFWDEEGRPLFANPVNGLTINEQYFFSTPDYKAYAEVIAEKIQPLFIKPIVSVNTTEYDKGRGNFHCATTSVFLPCY